MNEGTRQQQSPIKEQGPKSELKACRQSRQIHAVGTIYRIQSLLNHDRLERRYPPISSHLQTWNAFPVLLQSCWLQQRSGSGFTFENTNLQGQQVETLHIDSSSLSGSWHHFPFSAQRVGRKANLTRSWTVRSFPTHEHVCMEDTIRLFLTNKKLLFLSGKQNRCFIHYSPDYAQSSILSAQCKSKVI